MPDNTSAKNVPAIPGLLEYRKDQKKLYVRANKTWSLLTQEKEVKIRSLYYLYCAVLCLLIIFNLNISSFPPYQSVTCWKNVHLLNFLVQRHVSFIK